MSSDSENPSSAAAMTLDPMVAAIVHRCGRRNTSKRRYILCFPASGRAPAADVARVAGGAPDEGSGLDGGRIAVVLTGAAPRAAATTGAA